MGIDFITKEHIKETIYIMIFFIILSLFFATISFIGYMR